MGANERQAAVAQRDSSRGLKSQRSLDQRFHMTSLSNTFGTKVNVRTLHSRLSLRIALFLYGMLKTHLVLLQLLS